MVIGGSNGLGKPITDIRKTAAAKPLGRTTELTGLQSKDEYGLFLINTNKGANPLLSIRKLSQHDYLQRVYMKAIERKGEESFKVVFIRINDIET
jgi:hypothetical protein